ncbi:hypothetical protein BDR07DRAFT_200610 [Suillus spraguei]|nr:hypothetical protein BDR07DRAFT_200610 [Suillus spraguei]
MYLVWVLQLATLDLTTRAFRVHNMRYLIDTIAHRHRTTWPSLTCFRIVQKFNLHSQPPGELSSGCNFPRLIFWKLILILFYLWLQTFSPNNVSNLLC